MNSQCYRVIFSRTSGELIAVAETVSGRGKSGSSGDVVSIFSILSACLRTRSLRLAHIVVCLAAAWSCSIADAQVVAYRNAPGNQQATVLRTANGVPLVNIQTPSAQGVSRNLYSQFDIDSKGVILNNARNNALTQLGGWVQGNPWLAGGTARVILNEINSSHPSYLRGYVEVAGDRAHVILANPAGIFAGGAGFINASRATLTTGTPVVVRGNLDSYRVAGGTITIDGSGLDTSRADVTDIMARAVQVNAGVWANALNVSTGFNRISADHGAVVSASVSASASGTSATASAFALDVAQLGGMYGGKITLIGTEHGVGMRNAGTIGAGVGDVVVTVDGRLENKGSISAVRQLRTQVGDTLINSGTLGANDAVKIVADGVVNQGRIGSVQNTVTLNAAGTISNKGGRIDAMQFVRTTSQGVDNTGGAIVGNGLAIDAGRQSLDNTQGLIHANQGTATLIAATVLNTATQAQSLGVQGQSIVINADHIDNRNGVMRADVQLSLTGNGLVDNSAGQLSALQTLAVKDTRSGSIKTQNLTNTNGIIRAGKQLSIDSAAISGDGQVLSQGDLAIKIDRDYSNTGIVQGDGNVSLTTAGTLRNSAQLLAGKTLSVTAASIDNQAAGRIIANATRLRATDTHTFTNRGLIDSSDNFIDSPTINNLGTGRLYGDHIALSGSTLNNLAETINGQTVAPVIAARSRMDLGVATINNSDHGLIYSAGDLVTGNALDAAHQAIGMGVAINNASATIAVDGNATFNHQVVNNTNAHLETTTETSPGRRIVQFRLNGAPDKLDGSTTRLVNKGSGQILAISDWKQMGNEDDFRLVLPSTTYPFERYGAAFYRIAYQPGSRTGGGGDSEVVYTPEIYAYQPTDRIWQILGVTPPAVPTLIGQAPAVPGSTQCSGDNCYFVPGTAQEYAAWPAAYESWKSANAKQQASYQALNNAIAVFNNNLQGRMIREWTIYDGTEQIVRTKVLRSDPGMITSGGNVRFNSRQVNNANSQIIASGDVTGTQVSNTGLSGTQTVTTTGTAQYTYIKSHAFKSDDRRYDSRPYEGQSIQTSFTLDITPTNGLGPQQDRSIKSVPGIAPGSPDMVTRTSNPILALPDNVLFSVSQSQRYLIATDPQFVNYRSWLSSDAMLTQLQIDPNTALKRLGDGYYEQQLVQQQIQKAIGQRYAGNATSNEAQYQALMTAGVQMAQTFHYVPGIALSAEQMAALTSDIVWLVKQTVTLADGSTQDVLAPQVYLRAKRTQVTGEGTLIAGNNVNFQTADDVVNNGTIAARNTAVLAANNINNLGGRISATDTLLQAQTDINNLGGAMDGSNSIALLANRDINVNSTSVSTVNATTTGTNIDQVASVTGTSLMMSAGRDLNANAAVIGATGNATLTALRDVNLGTVNQNFIEKVEWESDRGASNWIEKITGPNFVDQANGAHGTKEVGVNRATVSATQDVATQINANNITISAGRDLNTQGTQVIASAALAAVAGRDLNISTANESASARDQHQHSTSGILSGTTTQTDDASSTNHQSGSTFSGNTTVLAAGNNANIIGGDVVSTQGTQITAFNDLNIIAATDSSSESHYKKETTSGVFSGGGLGVTVGSKMQSTDQTRATASASASTIGATNGNTTLMAGNHYTQIASTVIAPQGDVSIIGKQVDILAGFNTEQNTQETKFKQQGVTVQITNPIISAVQTMMSMQDAKQKTKNGRVKMLADAATALAAANAATALASSAAPAGGIDLAISIGSSSNQSKTIQSSTTAAGSTVASGGTTTIAATGAGQNSNLTIVGSEIAGNKVNLGADNQINLIAQRNTNEEHSTNKGSSASVGISIGSSGVMFNASASGSRGKGDGSDSDNTNTHVNATEELVMHSGGDTTIKGATAAGKRVTANVGGNLNIESLQDTSQYKSQQQSLGGSASVGLGGGVSGSISASRSKVEGNYRSVIEQSGINAGDNGFQIKVNGNTDVKGGKIASTDSAVANNRNSFATGTLTTSDIQNKSDYKAESQSISAGGGYGGGKSSMNGTGIGIGSASGSDSSVTKAGISAIAGDTAVRSDKDSSNTLKKNWNGQELQQDVEAQAKITETFGKEAGRAISLKAQEADRKRTQANDPGSNLTSEQRTQLLSEATEIDSKWGMGGDYRRIATALSMAAGGSVTGGLGQVVQSATINYFQMLGAEKIKVIADKLNSETARSALHGILACAGAAAQGSSCGSAALGAAGSVVLGNLMDYGSTGTAAQKESRKDLLGTVMAGVSTVLGKNPLAAHTAAVIEAENNTLYVWRDRVIGTDKQANDKVVVLGKKDAWTLIKEPGGKLSYPKEVGLSWLSGLSDSQLYDLTNGKDFENLRKGTDMGYYALDEKTQVFFQNGMDNHAPAAKESAALLAGLLNRPVGSIINDSHGIGGDVKEYLPNTLAMKDVLNEYTYRKLDAQGKPMLIVMHSAGNEDARKALQTAAIYGYQYPNLSFMSVGSPVSGSTLEKAAQGAGATYLGQVNNWRDPVTNSKTAAALALGLTGAGIWAGAQSAAPIGVAGGPMGIFVAGGIGGVAGGAIGFGSLFYGLQGHHPFTQYFQNQQLQRQVLDWQKNKSPVIAPTK